MAPVRRVVRRRRPYGTVIVLALVAVALGWVLIPLSRGESIPDPIAMVSDLFNSEVKAAEDDPALDIEPPEDGKVRVFVSGRPLKAYEKVRRDDLWNSSTGAWAFSDVDERLVESAGIMVDFNDIVGRVLATNKSQGYVFTEADFLPEGTRAGLSAGVPAGKRAMRIEVEKVEGIVGLQPGDRFDIVAALALDPKAGTAASSSLVGPYSELVKQQNQLQRTKRARVEVLVQNGVVVSALETRQVPTSNVSLTRGTTIKTIPIQEMVIAIAPEEVAPFMEALSVEADITCLARSGRPDDPLDSVTPSSEPPTVSTSFPLSTDPFNPGPKMTVVESIDDNERTLVPVPGAPVSNGGGGSR